MSRTTMLGVLVGAIVAFAIGASTAHATTATEWCTDHAPLVTPASTSTERRFCKWTRYAIATMPATTRCNNTTKTRPSYVWSRNPDLYRLVFRESGFRPWADNLRSTAFGLYQLLTETDSRPVPQSRHGLRYIRCRYDNPSAAWRHWMRYRWY